MPYCHLGRPLSSSASSSSSLAQGSPGFKKGIRPTIVVTPPARKTVFSAAATSSSSSFKTKVVKFQYKWELSWLQEEESSVFQLPGIRSINPAPFIADSEKVLAAKLMLLDEQAKENLSVDDQWFK